MTMCACLVLFLLLCSWRMCLPLPLQGAGEALQLQLQQFWPANILDLDQMCRTAYSGLESGHLACIVIPYLRIEAMPH